MVKRYASLSLFVAALVTWSGTALATPGSNIVSAAVVARGSFTDPVDLKLKIQHDGLEVLHAPALEDTVMQRIEIGPEGFTGWHSHPGPAVVLVTAGRLTIFSSEDPSCAGEPYGAGEAFVDSGQGHVHIGVNPSSTESTELWVTYFDVPPSAGPRIDAADPGICGF